MQEQDKKGDEQEAAQKEIPVMLVHMVMMYQ